MYIYTVELLIKDPLKNRHPLNKGHDSKDHFHRFSFLTSENTQPLYKGQRRWSQSSFVRMFYCIHVSALAAISTTFCKYMVHVKIHKLHVYVHVPVSSLLVSDHVLFKF